MNNTFIAFKALVHKDVLTFLRDRRALVVSVLTPIAIAAFFGLLFGGDNGATVARLPVAVVDEDLSPLSQAIVGDLKSDAALAVEACDSATARERVRSGKISAAIVLPKGFGAAAGDALFGGGAKPTVSLYYDPSQGMARPIVEGLFTEHVMQQATRQLMSGADSPAAAERALERVRTNERLASAARTDLTAVFEAVRQYQAHAAATPAAERPRSGGLTVPFALADLPVASGPRYNGYAHSFAGMSVQFILFMGIDAGVVLLLMRQQGVWRRLRAAPLSRTTLLGSRLIGTTLIALLILTLVYAAAMLVFKVRIAGSVPGFVAVAVSVALLAASTGLMIAALGRSVAATRGLSTFVVLLLVMLGGAWVPSFIFPAWLQRVALFVPTRWAVDGLDAMTWRGQPFAAALAPIAVLLGFAAAFLAVAIWRFDWEAD